MFDVYRPTQVQWW